MKFLILVGLHLALANAASWSYSGATGPSAWADSYATCGGTRNSPINLQPGNATYDSALGAFTFTNYDAAVSGATYTVSNAHSIRLDITGAASGTLPKFSGGGFGDEHEFVQLHFHWGTSSSEGSEHTVDGMAYPGELHLVHWNTKYADVNAAMAYGDGLAVLGIMLDIGEEDNAALTPFLDKLTDIVHADQEALITGFALEDLLPAQNLDRYHRYDGGLTTPGCDEVVIWTVFTEPILVSEAQMEKMRSSLMFNDEGETDVPLTANYRPVVAAGSRPVKSSVQSTDPADGGAASITAGLLAMATALLAFFW